MSDALLIQQVASGSGDPTSSMQFISCLATDPYSITLNTSVNSGKIRWMGASSYIGIYRLGDASNQSLGNIGAFQLTTTGSSNNGVFVMPTKTWINLTGNGIQLTAGNGTNNPAVWIVFSRTWPQSYSSIVLQFAVYVEALDVDLPITCDFTCRFGYFVLTD